MSGGRRPLVVHGHGYGGHITAEPRPEGGFSVVVDVAELVWEPLSPGS